MDPLATPDSQPDGHPAPELTWSAHPAAERRGPAVLGAVIVLAIAATVLVSFRSVGWSVLSAAFLVLALNRFYFPSRFSIDAEGITARFPMTRRRFRWRDVRRFAVGEHEAYLSTRARRSRLDAYRGLHVLFGGRRDDVVARIRAHLSAERAA